MVQEGFGGATVAKGGLFDPYRAPFAPLKVLYGPRFGSKHRIMVQMANVGKVCAIDPILDPG